MKTCPRLLAALALLALAAPAPARAQNADAGERPWAKGVPKQNQDAALELFREGNSLLRDSLWSKAIEKYSEALKLWDHPGIHYNLALALASLDRPIETHEHLQAALRYGPVPLDTDKHAQALRYMVLIEKQLTRVDIRCDLPGASVKLDGRELFVGPGRYEGLVTSGKHNLLATKEGYLPRELNELFPPGDTRVLDVQLQTESDLTELKRLWPAGIPWAVVAGGAAIAGAGVGLHLGARGGFLAYDQGINACVEAATGGCVPSLELQAKRQQAETLQGLAFAAYSVGGAALLTGAILVYVNRLQPYRREVDVVPPRAVLAPMLSPDGAGAQLFVSF